VNEKALLGLVRSRMDYRRDWPDVAEASAGASEHERVFDLSDALTTAADERIVNLTTLGRHLPFPIFAIAGTGHGVFIISGDDSGLYCYCYTSPVPLLFVQFASDGWRVCGYIRRDGGPPEQVAGGDPRVTKFSEAVAAVLDLVVLACDDTRHVVSYRLNRAERRRVAKSNGGEGLDGTTFHRICLDLKEHDSFARERGATVVPTPKRLHEVRAHWRHLQSGVVTRVRAHRRGSRGEVTLPRIYSLTPGAG